MPYKWHKCEIWLNKVNKNFFDSEAIRPCLLDTTLKPFIWPPLHNKWFAEILGFSQISTAAIIHVNYQSLYITGSNHKNHLVTKQIRSEFALSFKIIQVWLFPPYNTLRLCVNLEIKPGIYNSLRFSDQVTNIIDNLYRNHSFPPPINTQGRLTISPSHRK